MKFYTGIVLILILAGACHSERANQDAREVDAGEDSIATVVSDQLDTVREDLRSAKDIEWKDIEVMDYRDIKYQGVYGRYFSTSDFRKAFAEADSKRAVSDDAPCGDGEFWYKHDGQYSKEELDKISQYWFKEGSQFERFEDSVAVFNFKLSNHHYITYKGVRYDHQSTIQDFEKLFPKAASQILDMDVDQEGVLQVFFIKEEPNNISDGHLRLFFKNGKFYMIHHWFPC